MLLEKIIEEVQELPRSDRLQLLHFLVCRLASDDGVALIEPGTNYPIWSPSTSAEDAAQLLQLLEDNGVTQE